MDEQAGGRPQVWKCVARRCPHCRRWWLGIAAQIQHEFESLAWLRGKPMPPCNFTCNNARVLGELFSDADLLARFHREPGSTVKAILDLPIEFEFSNAANGAKVGSNGGKQATDSRDSLDVRLLLRAKHLRPGARFQFGCVQGQTTDSTLIVSYTPSGMAARYGHFNLDSLRDAVAAISPQIRETSPVNPPGTESDTAHRVN